MYNIYQCVSVCVSVHVCVDVCVNVSVCVCVCGPPSCVTAQRGLANLLVRVDYKANRSGVGGGGRTTYPGGPVGNPAVTRPPTSTL